jgi:hypothetical protein
VLVPVFVSAWEMDCCQPDATVGEEWTGNLFFYPPKPWWLDEGGQGDADPELGVIELDVDIRRSASSEEAMALVDAGDLLLGVKGLRGKGRRRVRGRVISEWHGPDPDGVKLAEVACQGLVRRVRLVPIEFERRGERSFYPVARLPAIDARSTSERRRNYMDANSDRHYEDDLLVDVEVS